MLIQADTLTAGFFSSAVADVFLTACMTLDTIHDGMAVDGEEVAWTAQSGHGVLLGGAGLLVYDCQYAGVEFRTRIGWDIPVLSSHCRCNRAGVKRPALFHHVPDRTDQQIDEMAATYCMPGRDIEVFFAREGQVIAL